jgi:tRNA threonylcarbamoyladenosine biosynthesis protein TsaE
METVRLEDIQTYAARILGQLPQKDDDATIVALSGELGAGKTTFVQALGKELGITDTMQSPTYVLMKSYPISYKNFTRLIHIDAYRLKNASEFAALKLEAFLHDSHALICVEWPERVAGALPKPDITVKFSSDTMSQGERYIHFY